MPRREPYIPQHRDQHPAPAPRRGLRATLTVAGVAVAATGIAVSSGIALQGGGGEVASAATATTKVSDRSGAASLSAVDLGDRTLSVSRSDRRTAVDPAKKAHLDQRSGGQVTQTEDLSSQDPRTIAKALLPQFGFGADQFSCLDSIYNNESGWDTHADNPTSSAYGIPQALPGTKMASAGPNWQNDAATQIKWGLGYIKGRYGTPCSAWGFKQAHGWY